MMNVNISPCNVYDCTIDGCKSYAVLSDFTDHKAAAVMTSILLVLKNFLVGGKTTINIVSDSPTSPSEIRRYFI